MTTHTDTGNTAGSGQNGTAGTPAGNGMAIAGLVLGFLPLLNIAGLVLSIIARKAARRQQRSATLSTVGIVVSALSIVFSVIMTGIVIAGIIALTAQCGDLGPGTHLVDGVTYTCS